MTDNPNAEMESEFARSAPQTGAPEPFLTVVARAQSATVDGLPGPFVELLGCTRTLLLFPAEQEADTAPAEVALRACLGQGATLVLLPDCPKGATLAEKPRLWLERALESQRHQQDLGDPRTAVLVTESLELCVLDSGETRGLKTLCDLHHEAFVAAWNRHLGQQSSTAGRPSIVVPVSNGTADSPAPTAERVAELERQVRELLHERQVLRENRDQALAEYQEEIRAHRELNERNHLEFEAFARELEVRAAKIDELHALLASLTKQEAPPEH